MFSFEQLNTIHVEITNRCQASCPMCPRNIHGGIDNPSLILTDWTLERFKDTFTEEVLYQAKCINFCGDFGDPMINSDLIDMCRYVKQTNPSVLILISTNGSARTTKWWKELAEALPENHKIMFALDGLEDTHALHRIGTDFNTVIKNASAFISAGGKAEWVFIRFKHNETQVETARQMSKNLGFQSFKLKDSKRLFWDKYPVLDRQGTVSYHIEAPSQSNVKTISFIDLKDFKKWKTDVNCWSFDDKELYIDANGYLMPCCIIGSFLYTNYDVEVYRKYGVLNSNGVIETGREIQSEVFSIIRELGGLDALDSKQHSIKDIMNAESWQTLLHKKWDEYSSSACKLICGDVSPFMKVPEQVNRTS